MSDLRNAQLEYGGIATIATTFDREVNLFPSLESGHAGPVAVVAVNDEFGEDYAIRIAASFNAAGRAGLSDESLDADVILKLIEASEQAEEWLAENGNQIEIGTNEEVDPWPLLDAIREVLAKLGR